MAYFWRKSVRVQVEKLAVDCFNFRKNFSGKRGDCLRKSSINNEFTFSWRKDLVVITAHGMSLVSVTMACVVDRQDRYPRPFGVYRRSKSSAYKGSVIILFCDNSNLMNIAIDTYLIIMLKIFLRMNFIQSRSKSKER